MSAPTDHVAHDSAASERIKLAWRWLHEFPVGPHPDLGRDGPVCPYMGRALDRGAVQLFPFDAREGDDRLIARARELRVELERNSRASERDIYLVYFLVPYALADAELTAMAGRVHAHLRPEFVQRGMLLGDFWPNHRSRGLHSATFRPFASPLPVLPIRNMIPGDLPFFAGPQVPAAEQLTYLGYYRRFFGESLPDYWAARLDAAEHAARVTVAAGGPPADPGG